LLITTNTSSTQINKINNLDYKSYYFADSKFDKNLLKDLSTSDKVLISIPPKDDKDIVLKTFDENFKKNKFNWVTYLSATSVYGDKKGEWVDEEANTDPKSNIGIARLNAEKSWLKYYKDFNLSVQIFRLTGIYSVENNVIKRLKKGTLKIVDKKNHYFSRIHVEDIAEILNLSLNKFNAGQIFNLSDDYPCSNDEIAQYAASLIKVNLPKKINLNDLESEMLKNFYKDSKKVSNKKMKFFFKFKLKYPTFKEGLDMIKNHIT
jgi:nucleoside-diphosphate-sugar epimerase